MRPILFLSQVCNSSEQISIIHNMTHLLTLSPQISQTQAIVVATVCLDQLFVRYSVSTILCLFPTKFATHHATESGIGSRIQMFTNFEADGICRVDAQATRLRDFRQVMSLSRRSYNEANLRKLTIWHICWNLNPLTPSLLGFVHVERL